MEKTLNILFVENSEDDMELTVAELTRGGYQANGYRVETIADMRQALETRDWDIVISNYHMPQFSAAQALFTLQESGKDYPFIIMSSIVDTEDTVSLLKHGAHNVLNKASLSRLVPIIEQEIHQTKERIKRRQAENHIRILSQAVEQSPVSVMITDCEAIINYINPHFEEMMGYSFNEAVGRKLDFTLRDQANTGLFDKLWHTIKAGNKWHGECCNVHKSGQLVWEYTNISPLKNDQGDITHFIVLKEDITMRHSYEEQLRKQAHYDELTGLANRALLLDRLEVVVNTAIRNQTKAALVFIDLDHFKHINDTHGHIMGDELLRKAAGRLNDCIRNCDTLARMGGDEFVIILPKADDESIVQRIAERIVEVFCQPFYIENLEHFVTASIGIAMFPEDGKNRQELLQNADLAMYKAKELGGNGYQFFTEEINRHLQQRLSLEASLRNAIPRNELFLCYQPILQIKNNQVVTFEALLRWRLNGETVYNPDQFIPLAENVGLTNNIGRWVLEQVCAEFPRLLKCSPETLRVTVNVSPKQLQTVGFADYVKEHIIQNSMHPKQLEFEITENVLLDNTPETHSNLEALCQLGVDLSIDNFGTGFSALACLQKYPFQTLKIDRRFIKNIGSNKNARLVKTMITMAHSLNLKVIAKGVETHEQLDFLHTCHCDQIQGFLISLPMPIADFPAHFQIAQDTIQDHEQRVSLVK